MQYGTMFKTTLHSVSSALGIPAVVILLLFIATTLFSIGSLLVELFTERRRLKVSIPQLIDQLQGKSPAELKSIIEGSGLLKRQKAQLIELTEHSTLPEVTRDALARRLIAQEESYYDKANTMTDLISKLGPMFGLMGTLIPLGPGLIALGQGDTKTLSDSLLTAFDTTVAGLISAAVCMCISKIRRHWYEDYLTALEALMTCILEEVKGCELEPEEQPSKDVQTASGY